MLGVRWNLAVWAMLIGSVLGCTSPHTRHADAHPEWDGTFPTAEADLPQTLAAIYDVGRGDRVVRELTVYDVAADPWREIPSSELGASAPPGPLAVVAVRQTRRCTVISRYLIVEGRLHAYLHHDVDSSWYCGKTSFVPAGSDHVETERTLADLAIESPWWENDTIELYQRGIAYVEVGRVEDAARMLEIGEGMMQWGVTRRWIDPGTGWPEHFPDQEVPRLRDRLREAIQSEARSSGP